MQTEKRRHSNSRLALAVLTGAYVISQFYRNYVAVIATQLIEAFQFTPQMFGLFAGAIYFTLALVQLPLGLAFDRFGVRKPVLFCVAVGSAGAITLPLTHNAMVAVLAHVALGIGCAPLFMGLLNYVLKSGNGPGQVRVVALASALGYLGAIAAGLPLAWGVSVVGWRWSLGIAGALMVFATAAIALTLYEDKDAVSDSEESAKKRSESAEDAPLSLASKLAFAALIPVCFALIAGGTFRMSWGGPYLADIFGLDVVQRGYAMTAASILALLWALSIPRLLRFVEVKTLVLCAFAAGAVAAVIAALWPAGNALLGVALVCIMFSFGAIHPLVMSQARSVVPARHLGMCLGLLNSMVFLGVAISNSSFGWIAENAARQGVGEVEMYSRLFWFAAAVTVVGLLCALFSPRIRK